MELIRQEKDGNILLKIEGAMTIINAAALREELADCFEQYNSLALDLGNVSECDVTGIQILLAARKSSTESGKPFIVCGTSPPLDDTFSRAGLNIQEFQNSEKEKSDG